MKHKKIKIIKNTITQTQQRKTQIRLDTIKTKAYTCWKIHVGNHAKINNLVFIHFDYHTHTHTHINSSRPQGPPFGLENIPKTTTLFCFLWKVFPFTNLLPFRSLWNLYIKLLNLYTWVFVFLIFSYLFSLFFLLLKRGIYRVLLGFWEVLNSFPTFWSWDKCCKPLIITYLGAFVYEHMKWRSILTLLCFSHNWLSCLFLWPCRSNSDIIVT